MPNEEYESAPGITGDTSGIDADALLGAIESGQPIPEQEAPAETAAPAQGQAAAQAPQYPKEVEFNWNGKPIKTSWENAVKWAQQGYDYSTRVEQLKRQQAEADERYKPYKLTDEYAKQNPDWWKHVQEAFEKRNTFVVPQEGQPDTAQPNPEIESLKKQITEISQFKSQFEQERQNAIQRQEDEQLLGEVKSIREQNAGLDWVSVDENGQSLEQRILKHAMDNGIQTFRAAFRDMMFDNLIEREREKTKELQTKTTQGQKRAGIIGVTPNSRKDAQPQGSLKNKSWNEIGDEALAMAREMGAAV